MKTPSHRPPRGPQAFPTVERRRQLFRQLSSQADQGDPHAAGWLLFLAEQRDAKTATP